MLSTRSLPFRIIFLVPIMFSLILGRISSRATKAATYSLTVLSIVGGNVEIQQPGATGWNNGKRDTLETGDKVKTDPGAIATITFFDGSTIELNSSTEVSLDKLLSKYQLHPKPLKSARPLGRRAAVVKLVTQHPVTKSIPKPVWPRSVAARWL